MNVRVAILGLAIGIGTVALWGRHASANPVGPVLAVSFAKAITFPTSVAYPSAIAAGDLNHDGIADLAVAGTSVGVLTYALGNGDGTFRPWTYTYSGPCPLNVTLADINQDGNLDGITTDACRNSITAALGDGHGGFSSFKEYFPGQGGAVQANLVDVNGDGIPDLVGSSTRNLFVLLGKGKGQFERHMNSYSGGVFPGGVAVGDLNHDNIPDLVVVNAGSPGTQHLGDLAVLLGKGDGTFQKPVRYWAGTFPSQAVIGAFNQDGNADIAVVSNAGVRVFLGKGDGTFLSPKTYRAGVFPHWIVEADFNNDGNLDLAVVDIADTHHNGYVSVLLGNGDGSFQPPVRFPVGTTPWQLITADFNNDGQPDIAVVNNGDSTVSVLLNTTKHAEQ